MNSYHSNTKSGKQKETAPQLQRSAGKNKNQQGLATNCKTISQEDINIYQVNLGKRKIATNLLGLTKKQPDVYLVQEPHINQDKIEGLPGRWRVWLSNSKKAGIILTNQHIKPMHHSTTDNSTALTIQTEQGPITFISAYASPLEEIDSKLAELQIICNNLHNKQFIIGADLNGRSRAWGYNYQDTRGTKVTEFISAQNLNLLNKPDDPPTFIGNGNKGWPDLTLVSCGQLAEKITRTVTKDETLSDHAGVELKINIKQSQQILQRFKTKYGGHKEFTEQLKPNIPQLTKSLYDSLTPEELDKTTENIINLIQKAAAKTYRFKKQPVQQEPTWWNLQLQTKKQELRAIRRRAQNTDQEYRQKAFTYYNYKKALFKKEVLKAKRHGWRNFCQQAGNPFGKHFKAVFRKGNPPEEIFKSLQQGGDSIEQGARTILEELYPQMIQQNIPRETPSRNPEPEFTNIEIQHIIQHLPKGKAPGLDSNDNIMIQNIYKAFPELLLALFNCSLNLGHFPTVLKKGQVILFHKSGRDKSDIKSYRPIMLLPTLGKVLEKLMTQRISYFFKSNNMGSNKQFGFKEGSSIDHALHNLISNIQEFKITYKHVALISIDIKGAFDNIQHNNIIRSLLRTNCPSNIFILFRSLLVNRMVTIPTNKEVIALKQLKGCPQGSCSGPFLWNLVADEILEHDWPSNVKIQAFADDFCILVGECSERKLGAAATGALNTFRDWTSKQELEICTEKTRYLLLSNLKRGPLINWGRTRIKKANSIKYLGVHIDQKLNWSQHIIEQGRKACNQLRLLHRIAGKTWGITQQHRRHLYKTVTERMLAHGAAAWCNNPTTRMMNKLNSIQRPFLLYITGAYRTTPTNTLQIITAISPLGITLEIEAKRIRISRLKETTTINSYTFYPEEYEHREVGFTAHPSKFTFTTSLSLQEYNRQKLYPDSHTHIYTDGSKTEQGTGAAFYYHADNNPVCWKAGLKHENSVFQAEIFAIQQALQYALTLQTPQKTIIHTDSQASLLSLKSYKPRCKIAKQIQTQLMECPQVNIHWIRAHVGNFGNEMADKLAKEATLLTTDQANLPLPISALKQKMKTRHQEIWTNTWREGDTGRSVEFFIKSPPKRSLNWPREILLFFSGHGPFPSYLHRFGILPTDTCACGMKGDPMHYATECPLTTSFHITKPSSNYYVQWATSVSSNRHTRRRIIQLINFIENNEQLLRL